MKYTGLKFLISQIFRICRILHVFFTFSQTKLHFLAVFSHSGFLCKSFALSCWDFVFCWKFVSTENFTSSFTWDALWVHGIHERYAIDHLRAWCFKSPNFFRNVKIPQVCDKIFPLKKASMCVPHCALSNELTYKSQKLFRIPINWFYLSLAKVRCFFQKSEYFFMLSPRNYTKIHACERQHKSVHCYKFSKFFMSLTFFAVQITSFLDTLILEPCGIWL